MLVSCRCSREDKTAQSTFTATGPTATKDLATWKANSGLVGQRFATNLIYQQDSSYFCWGYIFDNGILHEKKQTIKSTVFIIVST